LKTLANFKDCLQSHIQFLSGFPSLSLVLFFNVRLYVHGQLSQQYSGSQAAFSTNYRPLAAIEKPE
jgi:hypothetical protein